MSEHAHHQDVIDDLRPQHRDLRRAIPDVYRGFAELSKAALATTYGARASTAIVEFAEAQAAD